MSSISADSHVVEGPGVLPDLQTNLGTRHRGLYPLMATVITSLSQPKVAKE
jgi:hypothetical protein